MSAKALCDLGWFLQQVRTEQLSDDFFNYSSAQAFTTAAASTGTVAAYATGGVSKVLLSSAATDNDGIFVRSTNKNFLPVAGYPLYFAARFDYTNQATTTANVVGGFMSTTVLTMTDGIAPSASYSGAVIYKVDGGTTWSCQSSNGATKTTSNSNSVATNGTYTFEIDINDFSDAPGATYAEVVFKVNGIVLRDSQTNLPIKHRLAYSSLADMYVAMGAFAGSANVQTLYVDYISAGKLRSGINS